MGPHDKLSYEIIKVLEHRGISNLKKNPRTKFRGDIHNNNTTVELRTLSFLEVGYHTLRQWKNN